jgi:hypothetical protein
MTIDIAQACGLGAEPDAVKRWLSNIQQRWLTLLLVIDKADSPAMYQHTLPTRVGNRGSINTGRHYSQPSLYNYARGDGPKRGTSELFLSKGRQL